MDENNMNNVPENVTANPAEGDFRVSEEQPKPNYNEVQNIAPNYVSSTEQVSQETQANGDQPGKGAAIASLVLGIISVVCWFFGVVAIVGLITGIIGLVCSSNAKKHGFTGGIKTAGFVCSLIGLIGSALVFVACVACAGALGTAGFLDSMYIE